MCSGPGKYGITVNGIAPLANTRMEQKVSGNVMDNMDYTLAHGTPGTPGDIAPLIVYLASDEASDINGRIFGICGGRIDLHTDPVPIKSIEKTGRWTVDELMNTIPNTLTLGLANPAPPKLK